MDKKPNRIIIVDIVVALVVLAFGLIMKPILLDIKPRYLYFGSFLKVSVIMALGMIVLTYLIFIRRKLKRGKWSLVDDAIKISTFNFVVFSIPFAYSIILLGKSLYYETSLNLPKVGSADGWIGFIGFITGGLITMVALYLTISHENQRRRESKHDVHITHFNERADEVMPLLHCKYTVDSTSRYLLDHLTIMNISDNHIKDLVITSQHIVSPLPLRLKKNYVHEFKHNILFSSEEFEIDLSNAIQIDCDDLERLPNGTEFSLVILFDYTDIFDLRTYQLEYTAYFIVEICESDQAIAANDNVSRIVKYEADGSELTYINNL